MDPWVSHLIFLIPHLCQMETRLPSQPWCHMPAPLPHQMTGGVPVWGFKTTITPQSRERKCIWNIFLKINVYHQSCDSSYMPTNQVRLCFPFYCAWDLAVPDGFHKALFQSKMIHSFSYSPMFFVRCLLTFYSVPSSMLGCESRAKWRHSLFRQQELYSGF